MPKNYTKSVRPIECDSLIFMLICKIKPAAKLKKISMQMFVNARKSRFPVVNDTDKSYVLEI